jgi:hypothetical protein
MQLGNCIIFCILQDVSLIRYTPIKCALMQMYVFGSLRMRCWFSMQMCVFGSLCMRYWFSVHEICWFSMHKILVFCACDLLVLYAWDISFLCMYVGFLYMFVVSSLIVCDVRPRKEMQFMEWWEIGKLVDGFYKKLSLDYIGSVHYLIDGFSLHAEEGLFFLTETHGHIVHNSYISLTIPLPALFSFHSRILPLSTNRS